jgi:hypothetical protein
MLTVLDLEKIIKEMNLSEHEKNNTFLCINELGRRMIIKNRDMFINRDGLGIRFLNFQAFKIGV